MKMYIGVWNIGALVLAFYVGMYPILAIGLRAELTGVNGYTAVAALIDWWYLFGFICWVFLIFVSSTRNSIHRAFPLS